MELHRHWIVRLYGPLWIVAGIVCLLGPTLILPALQYEFLVGNWIAYPAGAILLLLGAYYIRDHSKPYLLRFDQTGVVWRMSGNHGAVPWHDVVRLGLEKKPEEPPRVKPKHLTLWVRHPLPGAGDADVELNGLIGYRLASVRELAESAEQINAALRRYTPGLVGDAPAVVPAAAAAPFGPSGGNPFDTNPFGGGAPAAHGAPRAPMEGECSLCGSSPAAYVVLQSVISVAIFHQSKAFRGWACRDCALATYRDMSARTLIGCWWGVGILGGPVVLLANRLRMRPALRLEPPRPTPGVAAQLGRPLHPGPRVLARPAGIVGLIVSIVLAALLAFVIVSVVLYS